MRMNRLVPCKIVITMLLLSIAFNVYFFFTEPEDSNPPQSRLIHLQQQSVPDDVSETVIKRNRPDVTRPHDDVTGENVVIVIDGPDVETPRRKLNKQKSKFKDSLSKGQKARKAALHEACREFNQSPSPIQNLTSDNLSSLKHTYIFDKHRLMYCYVPKVGCTSWKQLFLVSYGILGINERKKSVHKEFKAAFMTAGQMKDGAAIHKIKDYTKFLFVRNPFSRLLSAYREKIEGKNPHDKTFLASLITRWLARTDPRRLKRRKKTEPYTFVEFVEYVMAKKEENEHWNGQYELCHPCMVNYDFIGKYETMQDDATYFLRSATSDSTLRFPEADPIKQTRNSSSDDNMLKYYSTVPDDIFISLLDCFYRDLRLFGYSIPESIKRPKLKLSKRHLKLIDIG